MEEAYRGYSIKVEDRGLGFRVYVSPLHPWFPLLHCSHFECKGPREVALAAARSEVDRLVDWTPGV